MLLTLLWPRNRQWGTPHLPEQTPQSCLWIVEFGTQRAVGRDTHTHKVTYSDIIGTNRSYHTSLTSAHHDVHEGMLRLVPLHEQDSLGHYCYQVSLVCIGIASCSGINTVRVSHYLQYYIQYLVTINPRTYMYIYIAAVIILYSE